MKNSFPGYYRPTDDEFDEMWESCFFVLDANVLLNLYRYSSETRDELLTILEEISNRLWVPYQAALEYQQRRLMVIDQQASAYDATKGLLTNFKNKLSGDLLALIGRGRHPIIDVDHILITLTAAFDEIDDYLDERRQQHPDLENDDPVRESLNALLNGKVGPPYSAKRQAEILSLGKARYGEKIPPGYQDTYKGEPRQYGDLLLWFQIIDRAKELDQPVVFVTDDRKDDWWLKFKGRTIGPRPELVTEMMSEACKSFYMYSADPFMEYASIYLERQVNQHAIEEVREVRQRDESYMKLPLANQYISIQTMIADALRASGSMGLSQETLDAMMAAASMPIPRETLDAMMAAVSMPIPRETLDAMRAAVSIPIPRETLDTIRAVALLASPQETLDAMRATMRTLDTINATQRLVHGISKPSEESDSSEEIQEENSI